MHTKNKMLSGCLCSMGCEVLFGLSYAFTKKATEAACTFELLGWRFLVAFVIMTVCVLTGVIKVSLKGRNLQPLLIVSLFSPIIYFVAETIGIGSTSASESGVFLACIPVMSLIASSLILKKKPSRSQITGIVITLVGVLVTVLVAEANASFSVFGYIFLALAVISSALYSVFVAKASTFSAAEITYATLFAGTVVFVAIAVVQSVMQGNFVHLLTLPFENADFMIAVLYQGIGCSIFAFFLYNAAIARIGVNRTSSFIGVSTIVSIIAGVIFLQEKLSAWQIVGAVIIVIGIYTANSEKILR